MFFSSHKQSSVENVKRYLKQGCGSGYFVNRFRFQQSLDSIRAWTPTEPGPYLIYELADKNDYQNQQLTIYKGILLVKMIA